MRVLIVEDDEMLANTLMWFAEEFGDEATVCETGQQAITLATGLKPDLVLVDLGLPDMDGADVCRCLRSQPDLAEARIVAHTSHSDGDHRRAAKAAGFDDYFVKGCDFKSLSHLMGEMHEGRRPSKSLH